ncbi:hypothetical protein [Lysinibacter cavernae]|uniref:hypothetical protein n=1 Tax=Lysinibacter cavernae TaxID=1640652 RepID=UPI0014221A2F|nr:hypothetical protein [Lysinibacter cavernae]
MNLVAALRRQKGSPSIPLDPLINAAFVLLVIASATRYLLSHGLGDRWLWVAALSASLIITFAVSLVVPTSATAGMTVAVLVLWAPLVVIAPSFWWCAFSLFFNLPVPARVAVVSGVHRRGCHHDRVRAHATVGFIRSHGGHWHPCCCGARELRV